MELLSKFDFAILDFIQYNFRNEYVDTSMKYITILGNFAILWIVIGLILLLQKNKRKYGIMIFISLLLCFIIGNMTLKPIISRIRPFENNEIFGELLIKPPTDYSFPSGHTLASFACITILFHYNKKKARFWLFVGVLIAFSRMYLYVHYPTDIIFGIIIGIVIGKIAKWTYYLIEKQKLKRVFKRNNIFYQTEKRVLEKMQKQNNGEKDDDDDDDFNEEQIINDKNLDEKPENTDIINEE